jgi:hypothetical protein
MADVQTSEVDAKLAPVIVGPWHFVCCKTLKGWTALNNTILVKRKTYALLSRLKVEIRILFYGNNSCTTAHR